MSSNYYLPADLRKEYLYHVKGIDLITQCREAISEVYDDKQFWKDKIYYDYTIKQSNPIYEKVQVDPRQLYILLTYGLIYEPYLLWERDRYDNKAGPRRVEDIDITEELSNVLFAVEADTLPWNVFSNADKAALDIYMLEPRYPIRILLMFSYNYPEVYETFWNNYPNYGNVLLIFNSVKNARSNISYWEDNLTDITLQTTDLVSIIRCYRDDILLTNTLVDVYNRQFVQDESDEDNEDREE